MIIQYIVLIILSLIVIFLQIGVIEQYAKRIKSQDELIDFMRSQYDTLWDSYIELHKIVDSQREEIK